VKRKNFAVTKSPLKSEQERQKLHKQDSPKWRYLTAGKGT